MKTKKTNKKVAILKKRVHRQLKLAFVPHKSNQYRPHFIRRYGLVAVVVLAIGLQAGYNLATSGRVLGVQESVSAHDLLTDTNTERSANNLPALQLDDQLSRAAFLKAQDMFAQQYWAHVAPNGTTPWHWFGEVGYNYSYAGENLAKNFTTADAAMTAWMASPDHRANILDRHYSQVGFAVVDGTLQGKPASVIVALYGEPVGATASVAGVHTTPAPVETPPPHPLGVLTRLGVAIQSVTPAALGAIVLTVTAASVALLAHASRKKLPKAHRQHWQHQHHGLLKAGGMLSLTVVMLFVYGGGQI